MLKKLENILVTGGGQVLSAQTLSIIFSRTPLLGERLSM